MKAITVALFLFAAACGGLAWHKTAKYKHVERGFTQVSMRVTFGMCVFLAVWACTSYALWLAGVQLEIGTINDGKMAEQWWLGPVCIVWAVMAYASLRKS